MKNSTEKIAIITGASRGVGAGLVEAYRKSGYCMIANSRTIPDSQHPEILTVAGNIGDPATAERLIDTALSQFGRVDTLINKRR
jgi:NAD(P)-dependent dehydrogenase (short-subunit alcohol dehydrogenase family)